MSLAKEMKKEKMGLKNKDCKNIRKIILKIKFMQKIQKRLCHYCKTEIQAFKEAIL